MSLGIAATEDIMARAYPRAPFTGNVRYFLWDRPFDASAREVGGNGLFLRTYDLLPEGSLLTLRLALPGGRHAFTVLGKVVRVVRGGALRDAGMGIEFLDIAVSDRRRILEYIAERRPACA